MRLTGLADMLFPPECVGCGRPARGGFCTACINAVPRLGPFVCTVCGSAAAKPASGCPDCKSAEHDFDCAVQAVAFQSIVRTVIHRFKYKGEKCLAGPLCLFLLDLAPPAPFEAVTWVPSQPDRTAQRGHDHGRALAYEFARLIDGEALPLLRRTRRADPQMRLDPALRRSNMAGALVAEGSVPPSVLVVDDVFTTGATANEAARALKAGGACRVQVGCIARTPSPGEGLPPGRPGL